MTSLETIAEYWLMQNAETEEERESIFRGIYGRSPGEPIPHDIGPYFVDSDPLTGEMLKGAQRRLNSKRVRAALEGARYLYDQTPRVLSDEDTDWEALSYWREMAFNRYTVQHNLYMIDGPTYWLSLGFEAENERVCESFDDAIKLLEDEYAQDL